MILLMVLTLVATFGAYHTAAQTQNDQYQACTDLARTNPAQAKTTAEEWVRVDNTPSAHHCLAIALFALKQYEPAAKSLETLSDRVTEKNLSLWANVLRQAARAWELHGDRERAIIALTKAIQETADRGINHPATGRMAADLLIDRGRIYASVERNLYAFQDLDQALSLSPGYEPALLLRAEVSLKEHAYDMAKADLKKILDKTPNHPQATALLQQTQAATAASQAP